MLIITLIVHQYIRVAWQFSVGKISLPKLLCVAIKLEEHFHMTLFKSGGGKTSELLCNQAMSRAWKINRYCGA